MTPAARVQAAIELLDDIIAAARGQGAAADTLIARYFAQRRYAGSKDRRAVREHVYAAIRLCGEVPVSGRAAMLALAGRDAAVAEAFGAGGHAPAAVAPGEPVAEAGVAPEWLLDRLRQSGLGEAELAALLDRAPLDLRVNPLRSTVEAVRAELPDAAPVAAMPWALRLGGEAQVEQSAAWQGGGFEVQDLGSQIVSLASGAAPGMQVVDLCAGGGGKTLAMAAMMAGRGAILASDSDRGRLSRLLPRAERAGVSIVETRLLNPGREEEALDDLRARADLVLVDAPCSGTGTWRRNPEARWRLTPATIERYAALQARLLDLGAALVRPGGALVHIVCSLIDAEGADQVAAFLSRHPGWRAEPLTLPLGDAHGDGVRLNPHAHSTDGFFVAKMIAP